MGLQGKHVAECPFKSLVDGSSDFWTASGGGTNEFYYNQTDVPIKPLNVQENESDMTAGTLGSLSAGEWGWGDNDSLGNETVYVRLADDADPDSKAADFVECSELLLIYQATTAVETINLSIRISNSESSDADIVLAIRDGSDNLKWYELWTIKSTDGTLDFTEKIVLEPDYKLLIMSDKEKVAVHVSEYEG